MQSVKILKKAVASKAGITLGTHTSAKAKSTTPKTIAEHSVTKRKVHVAPKTGSVSRATAKSAVKKAIQSRNVESSKK